MRFLFIQYLLPQQHVFDIVMKQYIGSASHSPSYFLSCVYSYVEQKASTRELVCTVTVPDGPLPAWIRCFVTVNHLPKTIIFAKKTT